MKSGLPNTFVKQWLIGKVKPYDFTFLIFWRHNWQKYSPQAKFGPLLVFVNNFIGTQSHPFCSTLPMTVSSIATEEVSKCRKNFWKISIASLHYWFSMGKNKTISVLCVESLQSVMHQVFEGHYFSPSRL